MIVTSFMTLDRDINDKDYCRASLCGTCAGNDHFFSDQ